MNLDDFDETGLPIHMLIGVTRNGQGPVSPKHPEYHHSECWCQLGTACIQYPPRIEDPDEY